MVLLPSILNTESHRHPLLILQSSLAQTSLPIVRHILTDKSGRKETRRDLLFCLLYPPSSFIDQKSSNLLEVHDWIDHVPGYTDVDTQAELLAIVEKALQSSADPFNVIIDSVDTLLEDGASLLKTYKCLSKLYALVKKHTDARLILHSQSPSSLLPLLTQTAFSSSLSHIIVHPPVLIAHLATEFLMPPPPLSPLQKFWSVFLPVSERTHDTDRLVFGLAGEGSGIPSEFVVELVVREGTGRKRGVERVLEGWSDGPCELSALETLRHFTRKQKEQTQAAAPDPTQNLPFNLNLTSSQQESRAQVPLPYEHEGTPITRSTPSAIFYDPDSADDIDDDDPDEDLDI
ncbi:hypothetical protein GALMADRAFT_313922 [Galerina marginata CBS 339.88]|uniref:Elongator complex protein 5 n=1 Tax=Galerina marginata (strain CBS 339.88) TaxID=685588 RepID=A0A067U123_GALM3|nr:hypothetical protein GALMADRAFT_313922 [Galerina marginata CBS 339.88]